MSADEEVYYCAKTGRRISRDGNVIYLAPTGHKKPMAADMPVASQAEAMTIKCDLRGQTLDEINDRATAEELAALAARFENDDDI